jgi:alanine racemase
METPLERAGAVLTIDLDAIASNYRFLRRKLGKSRCAAVVKADAYGLGAAPVASRLLAEGCRTFFVAHLQEGLDLRVVLGAGPEIYVLNGTPPGTGKEFTAAGLVPVVNTLGELQEWRRHASAASQTAPLALQVDTGMSRLGLSPREVETIAGDTRLLDGIDVTMVMSHLACADERENPANRAQLREFRRLREMLPSAPASLANSSGIFLDDVFHHSVARPGAALYGINPVPGRANPMKQVAKLQARVIQLREVPAGAGIGYGHTTRAAHDMRLATLSVGYADGWPRGVSAGAFAGMDELPLAGRVSMDSTVVDATRVSKASLREGMFVDLIGRRQTVDDIATACGTIGYEILCGLGRRLHRSYKLASVM